MKILKTSVKELFYYLLIACFFWQPAAVFAEQKIHRDDWYLSQPEDYATIQMSGHELERDAIAYIEKENLSGEVGYYRTQYKGLPWYAVTYGNFQTIEEARSHLELLPEELQQHSPWPRTFKAINALISVKESGAESADEAVTDSNAIDDSIKETKKPLLETNWEEGQAAYDNGDFITAYNIWQMLAEQGDELSQFNLGVMYSRGEGTEKNGSKALMWYMKSAEQGYAPAQFNLGAVYLGGDFTPEDASKAAAWWQLAAEQGFVQAQFNLASLYCRGIGVSRDQGQCKFWYGRAASNGDTHARKMLDHLIANENKEKEETTAASESVAETSPENLSEVSPGAEGTTTAEQSQAESEALKETSDEERNASLVAVAQQSLNEEQLNEQKQKIPEVRQISGDELRKLARAQKAFTRGSYKNAHDIWLPLAKSGIADAQYSLGFLYQSGWGLEQDLLQAVAWYTSAAEQGEARAQFNLGVLLLNGEDGVEKDTETGVLWLIRSAEANNSRAIEFLIKAYENGIYGIEKSAVKAEYWKSR